MFRGAYINRKLIFPMSCAEFLFQNCWNLNEENLVTYAFIDSVLFLSVKVVKGHAVLQQFGFGFDVVDEETIACCSCKFSCCVTTAQFSLRIIM